MTVFTLNRSIRYVLAVVAVVVLGKLIWVHRNDDWVRNLSRPGGPATVDIKFDNGSVREVAVTERAVKSDAGKLKKCLIKGQVTYTDQDCPIGAKSAPISGGTVVVLESQKSMTKEASSAQGGQKTLRDALDISGGENLKDKAMERSIGK